MLEFWEFMYMCIFVLVLLVLKEIMEYVFITRKGGNVINIEDTQSNTKTNEIGTNTRLKKKKSGKDDKIIEGFFSCPGPVPTDDAPTCDKAEWLFCDINFNKLKSLISKFYATYQIVEVGPHPNQAAYTTRSQIKITGSHMQRIDNIYFVDESNVPFVVRPSQYAWGVYMQVAGYDIATNTLLSYHVFPNVTINKSYNFYHRPRSS
jgi:hypothetical protein